MSVAPAAAPDRPRPALDPRHRCVPKDVIVRKLTIDGWARELSLGREAEALAGAASALEVAVAGGAGFARDASGGRLFDPVEIGDVLEWLAESGRYPLWRELTAASRLAYVDSTRAGDRSSAATGAAPPATRFKVRLRRTFDLRRFSPASPLRLVLPTPLPSSYHQDVVVAPEVSPDLGARIRLSGGRMELRLEAPADPLLTVGAAFAFVGRPPEPRADAGRLAGRALEVHLRPVEGLIRVTPRVATLARRLAGDAPPLDAVTAFWTFLTEAFHFRDIRYDELRGTSPVDWALDHRGYDCLLCAALMAALCRARGIPARIVNGHYLSRLSPANHGWVEIWIDDMGWLPADLIHHERNDPQWRPENQWWRHFSRRWDYRMVFETLPLDFTGPMSVRFPDAWQMLHTPAAGALDITYIDIADGSLIYRDSLTVDWA